MADRKFTLLELHLDGDTQLGPKRLGKGTESTEPTETERSESGDSTSSRPSLGTAVKALAFIGVVALVARTLSRRLGGVPDEFPESIEVGPEEIETPAE